MHWHVVWKIKQIERQGAFTRLFISACHLEAPDIIMEMNRGEHLKKICAYDKSRDAEKHSDDVFWSDKAPNMTGVRRTTNTFPSGQVQEINAAGIIPQVLCGYVAARISEFGSGAGHLPTLLPPVRCILFFLGQPPSRRFLIKQGHNSAPASIPMQANVLLAHYMAQ